MERKWSGVRCLPVPRASFVQNVDQYVMMLAEKNKIDQRSGIKKFIDGGKHAGFKGRRSHR